MMLVHAGNGGSDRYGHLPSWRLHAPGDHLIFSVSPARVGGLETEWYVRHIGCALEKPEGCFLFHFTARDLQDRGARVILAFRGRIAEENLVGARYTHFDADGLLWFRGAYVRPEFQGRRIGPAMAVYAMLDWARRDKSAAGGTCAVIVDDDGQPNPKSVAALEKIGFMLSDSGDVVKLTGGCRDRHLLRYATMKDGSPVLQFRRMYLDRTTLPRAREFLQHWRG